jgi:glycosyltransferase involved in cell wall biosynthesis
VTEPAFLAGSSRAAACLAALRVRHALRPGRRPTVVSYAIGNSDPRTEYRPRSVREKITFRSKWWCARLVMRWTDRLAFGTPDAEATYARLFSVPRRQERTMIPALPAACSCGEVRSRPGSLVFLGAFVARKGLPQLLDAWPAVSARVPGASLTLVGKGELVGSATELAARDDAVSVVVDPSRDEIHGILREASVLVLASQPSATWREQVGLPLVEALQHGCTVVTTDQTGLAPWLRVRGHRVVSAAADVTALAEAISDAALRPLSPEAVLASLPAHDGRAQAHAWMFGDSGSGRRD